MSNSAATAGMSGYGHPDCCLSSDTIRHMYYGDGLNLRQIAARTGHTVNEIRIYCQLHGIQIIRGLDNKKMGIAEYVEEKEKMLLDEKTKVAPVQPKLDGGKRNV